MEEIIIQFLGLENFTINGILLSLANNGRIRSWKIEILNSSTGRNIPSSSEEQTGEIRVTVNNIAEEHPFWRIEEVNPEGNVFLLTVFPNRVNMLTRN